MKKNILMVCTALATFGFMAFGIINWDHTNAVDSPMDYSIDSRYMTTITKDDLHQATTVLDIVPPEAKGWREVSFENIRLGVIQGDDEVTAMGYSKELNPGQIELLQSADYSSDFYIKARTKDIHPETGRIESYAYYLTVIPEQETEYPDGREALVNYLKENSIEETANAKRDQLQPGKVSFTVTTTGALADVVLDYTCGYSAIDAKMQELICNLPMKWKPASNAKGKKVDQRLVFFFGKRGC